jgi:hypothetical protein
MMSYVLNQRKLEIFQAFVSFEPLSKDTKPLIQRSRVSHMKVGESCAVGSSVITIALRITQP